ncbi:reversion-inducing cysteine-rich protein with Kazal motifs [Drosophila miranda]|uniref:reversion-inducing cysteine-rich protein with Kazal motifs n=1 Tax=Drosophila miranda TaxID=7229 RepID=UPI0007E890E9|nr:reversion-inducing cysteine-rich protein with Kazal motifs [Drosophila miranda]XP_017138149.1 reversion-inducing cysteine-rich protein with Kazal motifs [Drosophila miranda]
MRPSGWQWLVPLLLLLSLSLASAVRQLEENQSAKKDHPHASERQVRRRNKSNASVDQQRLLATGSTKKKASTDSEDYDWLDLDADADAGTSEALDSSETVAVHSVRAHGDGEAHDIFTCCNQVFGSCRTACENLSLVEFATGGAGDGREELRKYCQLHQVEFWTCINQTFEAVTRGADWSGRRCCQFGVLQHCRNVCASANQAPVHTCRRSDEQMLYDCLERQDAADRCCGQARTSECLQACRAVFEPSNASQDHVDIDSSCGDRNLDVVQCIHNHTDMAPLANAEQYLPCCEYSNKEHCRHTCRNLLHQNVTQIERSEVIFTRLEAAGCGTPLPHLPFWQCFLTVTRKLYVPAGGGFQSQRRLGGKAAEAVGGPNHLGMDAAKRQCCEQASSHRCRRLCTQIFTSDWWETRASFDSECLEQPDERELRRCVESVDAPCEQGCDGLSFCSNFNNRPTELFRSCTPAHDAAAREDFLMLQQRGFVRVLGQELFIKNTTRCAPDKWQALVCALQLQPCTRMGLFNGICSEDCNELLEECLDWTRQQKRPQAICSRLQPQSSAEEDEEPLPCISLRSYLKKGSAEPQDAVGHYGLTSPCSKKPCNASEVCVLQRRGIQGYACIPGCSLGQASSLIVPFGAYVRLSKSSMHTKSDVGQLLTAEHIVCSCGLQGHLEQCQPLPSYSHAHCTLPGGRSFRHGSSFYLECNLCSCFAGEITCTKKQCRLPGFTDSSFTSLPCNCAAHYVPVCGSNGNTYPSACVAKCHMPEGNYVYGACNARNACQAAAPNSCPQGTQCLDKRKVCLASMQRPCQQYVCVNATASNCSSYHQGEVCDTQGRTHPNACALLRDNPSGQVAYWSACQSSRSAPSPSPVCGINGVTYRSIYAARAEYVLTDYVGRCREVGLLASEMGRRCRTVQCPAPVSKNCRLIVPPGACCPLCAGGAFRIIYSRKQFDRAMYGLRAQSSTLLTLHGVLQQLDGLVQVSECQLTGFLTMEVGIFVALVPSSSIKRPTRLQLEACAREAEKISSLINAQSPRITTNLALSCLTVSHLLEPTPNAANLYGSRTLWLMPLILFLGRSLVVG